MVHGFLFVQSFHLFFWPYMFSPLCCHYDEPPHFLTIRWTHCIGSQPLDLIGIHLLCCSHGGEWISSHDVIRDAFTSIVQGCHNIQMLMKI